MRTNPHTREDAESLAGSPSVYPHMRPRLARLYALTAGFEHHRQTRHHDDPLILDLVAWDRLLAESPARCFTPRARVDPRIYVDASTGKQDEELGGIDIVMGRKQRWRTVGWRKRGHDIAFGESLALEIGLWYAVAAGTTGQTVILHSDNTK